MEKYYRVIKENFLWDVGVILQELKKQKSDGCATIGYSAGEYISSKIIENTPEYFERVYPVNTLNKIIYKSKELDKEYFQKQYKESPPH